MNYWNNCPSFLFLNRLKRRSRCLPERFGTLAGSETWLIGTLSGSCALCCNFLRPSDPNPNLVLVTVDLTVNTTDREVAAAAIGVPATAINVAFGVTLVDPGIHCHSVKVDYAAFRTRRQTKFNVSGPYPDPVVEPLLHTQSSSNIAYNPSSDPLRALVRLPPKECLNR